MKQATLHQLQILEAIARHRSFTRAAEELELTQPTVSQQVKRLTQIIGMLLFEQMGKQLSLTPVGKQLSVAAQTFLDFSIAQGKQIIDRVSTDLIPPPDCPSSSTADF